MPNLREDEGVAALSEVLPEKLPEELPAIPEILILDDSLFCLSAWVDTLSKEARVHTASSLAEMASKLRIDDGLLSRLACVIVDFYIDGSDLNGLEVARFFKRLRQDLPVFLSSNAVVTDAECLGAVDRVIEKMPVSVRCLLAA